MSDLMQDTPRYRQMHESNRKRAGLPVILQFQTGDRVRLRPDVIVSDAFPFMERSGQVVNVREDGSLDVRFDGKQINDRWMHMSAVELEPE